MPMDIRDKAFISHDDVIGLNFINDSGPYIFRRHYRQGLRSHILQVLERADVEREKIGSEVDGVRWYPKAKPLKMFRIFRTRLATLDHALREINRVKITERYLAPDFLATSSEFIVDYETPEGRDLMLCGFQEYEAGEIVDPWSILDGQALIAALFVSMRGSIDGFSMIREKWSITVRKKAAEFIRRIKEMIYQAGYLPDLAGIGNLVVIPSGEIKLVDINNISKVFFDSEIRLDDRGYPVCDKSIEALYLLEEKVVGGTPDRGEEIYRTFFDPGRRRAVKGHEEIFYRRKKEGGGYPAPILNIDRIDASPV
jgi:hypothetical protein